MISLRTPEALLYLLSPLLGPWGACAARKSSSKKCIDFPRAAPPSTSKLHTRVACSEGSTYRLAKARVIFFSLSQTRGAVGEEGSRKKEKERG